MRDRRSLLVMLVAFAAVIAAGVFVTRGLRTAPDPEPRATPPASSAQARPAPPPAQPAALEPLRAVRFEVGDRGRYKIGLAAGTRIDVRALLGPEFASQAPPSQVYDLRYNVELGWQAVGIDDRGATLAIQLRQAERSLNGQDTPLTPEEAEAAVLVRVGPDGRFDGFGFEAALGDEQRMGFVHLMQMLEPALPAEATGDAAATRWEAAQADDSGDYVAEYERDARRGPRTVGKRRLRYTSVRPISDGVRADLVVEASRDSLTFAEDGRWLDKANVRHRLSYQIGEQVVATKRVQAVLKRLAGGPDLAWAEGVAERLNRFEWVEPEALARMELQLRVRRGERLRYADAPPIPGLGGRRLDSVLDEFAQLTGTGSSHDRKKAFILLTQYLRLHPDRARAVLAAIAGGALADSAHADAIYVLEIAGTPEAEAALVAGLTGELASDLSAANRMRVASALSDVPDPSRQALEALSTGSAWSWDAPPGSAAADEEQMVRTTTLLALGHLAETKPGFAEAVGTELAHHLGQAAEAGDANYLAVVAGAMGNTRDADHFSTLKEMVSDSSQVAHVRRMAAHSAAKLDHPDTWSTVWSAASAEPDAKLRGAFVKSLVDTGQVPAAQIEGVVAQLRSEPDAGVRLWLVRLLALVADEDPAVKAAFLAHLSQESDAQVLIELGKHVDAAATL